MLTIRRINLHKLPNLKITINLISIHQEIKEIYINKYRIYI